MLSVVFAALALTAQDTTRPVVAWSGFVDSYYAWDGGRPATFDRVFTTQAVRHNEFNINLAHVAVAVSSPKLRGRLALQAGTSVQANYSAEPASGSNSGPTLSRHIQEATIGARVVSGLWVDGGIYFSYLGLESWISRENPTYTRSLTAEYSPYYLSGVRATWQPNAGPVTIQLHVTNGWQNIAETNQDKAVGLRVDWQASPSLLLTCGTFIGHEAPTGVVGAGTRVFNQLMAKATLSGGTVVQGQVDYGRQGDFDWYGWNVAGRRPLSPTFAISGRVEGYRDPDQVIVVTGTANPLSAIGASIGLDVGRMDGVVWRTEVKYLRADAHLFPRSGAANAGRGNVLVVSSLALTL